ncbi:GNAT family N-acetyltransferase [Janibacter indicus]|uniref:Predicted acetyltransferase n=1 Tax=Janibacter indicus TaxID=857417 RepID=A0A1W2AFM6_9MICO|nr:GNAT family N-acetyltransferase [Janibacter indicus]SMC59048.1 Predicted acetyltransferase [Janibacter indicus]
MTSDIEITRIDPSDESRVEALLELDKLVWADAGRRPREAQLRDTPQRAGFIATRGGEPAATAGSWDVEVSVPAAGGEVASLRPAEGLTWIGVHPDHRRRGVLTAVMGHHLRWTRDEQGRSLSVLKASEHSIYGRYGYGVASTVLRSSFGRGTSFAAPPQVRALAEATTLQTTTAGPEQGDRWHDIARAAAATGAGQVVRSREDCARLLHDSPESRGDREPARLLWATREGRDVGAAYFHRTPRWSDGRPEGEVGVFFLVSTDVAARLALAERLVDLDLMGSTGYWVTLDDPLVQWLPSSRALGGGGPTDNLWLRIVDLPTAVTERGHAADLDVVVEIGDAVLPEQAGRWRWTATRDGVGTLERTDAGADVTLDIGDLGAGWLGGQTIAARAAAGYVTGDPAAVAALDAALRTPVGPVTTIDF